MKPFFTALLLATRCWSLLICFTLLLSGLTTQAQNNWTGTTNRDWNTAGNWSAGVPTAGSDVVIPSSPNNQPIISTTALANSVEVQSGALLSISNSGSLTINGSKSVGVNPTTGFYNGGSVLNQGAVVLGNQSSVGQYGLENVASFSNTSGGSISIDRASFCGLFNQGGSFVNSATITIGGSASVGQYGLYNSASFSNTSGGSISIDRTSFGGLINDRAFFVNSARITIGASATVGADGLHNNGTFSNTAGGNISIDRASNIGLRNKDLEGIVNTTGGSFVNSATITIGASVTGTALDNRSVVGSGSQNVPVFNNQGCSALIQSLGNAVITNTSPASFSNTGTIIENSTGNSSISFNGGLVQNNNGGTFTVDAGNAAISSAGLIWTGCVSRDWNSPANWYPTRVPTATDDVIIPPGPINQPVLTGAVSASTVEVQSGASLSVTNMGSLSVNGSRSFGGFTTAFYNRGTVVNGGGLVVGNLAGVGQYGLWNAASFSNVAGGSIQFDRSTQVGLFNQDGSFVNAGGITIGANQPVGDYGLWNRSSFSNVEGGSIYIDRSTVYGLWNQVGNFINAGGITIGANTTGKAVDNQNTFDNQGCSALLQSLGSGVITNLGSFSNTGAIIENSTGNSGISFNGGLILNKNGGMFTVNQGSPPLSLTATNPTTCNPANGSLTITGLQASTAYTLSYTLNNTPTTLSPTSNANGQIVLTALAAGNYALLLSGSCVAQPLPLSATLSAPPNITVTTQPAASSAVCGGASVAVSVVATGTATAYQWYKGGSPVSSQTTATLSLPSVQDSDAGIYVLVATDCNSVTSDPFTLSVDPAPVVTLIFGNNATVMGAGTPTITVPPLSNTLVFQATGGSSYERAIIIDRINGYEIRQTDSNSTGIFPINRLGLFTLTVTGTGGCKRTVQAVLQSQ